ncbi:MAG: adenylate/guanylate cyclase domain-containing protein [Marinibacterium sp.]
MTEHDPAITEQRLSDWLVAQGLRGTRREQILDGYCDRLLAAGLTLMRVHVAQSAFHPKYGGIGFDWHRENGLKSENYDYTSEPPQRWLDSPFHYLLTNGQGEMRVRLAEGDAPLWFPILDDLKAQGGTDYLAVAFAFGQPAIGPVVPPNMPEGILMSWTSDGAAGFTDAQLDLMRDTLPALGIALKTASNQRIARELMRVYLGQDAGNRVLSGEIQRGSLRTIEAAICYFDLVGFTALAEKIPGSAVIEMLNAYFAVAVRAVEAGGGQVLKFMGDGLMAMFDIGDARTDACAALDAACRMSRDISTLNDDRRAQGLPATGFTLAVHDGEILYGNIGGETRLDFTVIGPAVNLAARLSEMHKAIGHDILVSESVRRAAGPDRCDLVSVGRYMLRSAVAPMEVFTLFEGGD